MREHPIPQDIVGYRFHIIGSMTLKQFAELAVGVILALIVYATNLPQIIKWPLIFLFAVLGSAAAFLPVAGQPLDHWLNAFFRALYKPTQYFWEKSRNIPSPLNYKPGKADDRLEELDLTPMRRQRIKEYLATVSPRARLNDEDQMEQERIQAIISSFAEIEPETIESIKGQHKPKLKVTPHSLKNNQPQTTVAEEDESEQKIAVEKMEAEKKPTKQSVAEASQLAQEIDVPKENRVKVREDHSSMEDEASTTEAAGSQAAYIEADADNNENTRQIKSSQDALFNKALPFPSQPTEPNKIVGMLLTPNKELIPDAIIEVTDEDGRVLRAVKSNALGQFFITTPLSDGHYTLRVEHDRYQFSDHELSLNHEIVEPIEIRSLV